MPCHTYIYNVLQEVNKSLNKWVWFQGIRVCGFMLDGFGYCVARRGWANDHRIQGVAAREFNMYA